MAWLIMTLVAFFCLVKYGRNIPMTEDWLLVPPLTGNEPNLMNWLWAQNNEHRIPFPRLVLLVLLKIAKGDFRVGMLLNITALSAISYAMIRVAQAVRGGRTKFADAFFPIVLLHLGNWENLFWSWQFSFVFPTALVCTVLLVLVSPQNLSAPGSAVIAGICLMLLPLCGANGLLFLPFLAPWFIYYGFVRWRAVKTSGGRGGDGGFLIGSALVALLIVGLYLIGYERPAWTPPNPGIGKSLKAAAQFSALGFGPVARSFWKMSVIAAIGILLPSAGVAVLGVLRHHGPERRRSLGVLVFFCSVAVFALAMGWARAGVIPIYGSWPIRYVLLAVPAFCTVFFVWELYGPEKLRTVVQSGLLIGMCLLIPFNTTHGFWWRDWYLKCVDAIERDLAAGIPRSVLAKRHQEFLFHSIEPSELDGRIRMLQEAGIGPFAQLQEDRARFEKLQEDRARPDSTLSMISVQGQALVTREIRYRIPKAEEVFLVWGINGWGVAPEEIRPPGTVVKNSVMHTQMGRAGDVFTAKVRAPAGATIDYGFLITKIRVAFESKAVWDGDRDYRMILSKDSVDEISTTLNMVRFREMYNGPNLGWYQSVGIGILFSGCWLFRRRFRRAPV
jgi:hypothetical protein